MHIGGAVARAREAVAEPEEGALALADQSGELLDRLDRRAGDRRRPGRIARAQMRFKLARRVGVFVEIIPVRLAVAEQAMHHRAGERAVGAGLHQHRQIGLLHGAVHIDVDRGDLGAALFARAHGVRHHVDLGVHRIGAPDHHQIGFRHFARIDAGDAPDAGGKAGIGRIDADGGMEAGIFLGVAQPVDAVAHHQTHGAGIIIRPHRLGAVPLLGLQKLLGDQIERVVPGNRCELARCPWRRCGAADAAGGRCDARARRSAPPWRRSRRRCSRCPSSHARGRWCARRCSSTSSAQVDGQSCGQAE